ADTDRWLARPEGWEKNGGGGPSSDKLLARVQFAWALASAVEAGRGPNRASPARAAVRPAEDQAEDRSGRVVEHTQAAPPAASRPTHGRPLPAGAAREFLRSAAAARCRSRTERAEAWLGRLEPASVLDASTLLLAEIPDRRPAALGILRRGQSSDGGWGPFE